MTLYPFSLIYLLLPLPWSLNLFSILHLYLGGLGMFFLARHWTRCSLSSAVAGIAFTIVVVVLAVGAFVYSWKRRRQTHDGANAA